MIFTKIFDFFNRLLGKRKRKPELLMITNGCLVDSPYSDNDVCGTDELELSMRENGFVSRLLVTDYGMESGKYMIVDGHRRRAAAVKVFGEDFAFPCVVRDFSNEQEVLGQFFQSNAAVKITKREV